MPAVNLDAADAEELADFLLFLSEWAAADYDQLSKSLARFMSDHPYGIDVLLADLVRFKAMLSPVTKTDFLLRPERRERPRRRQLKDKFLVSLTSFFFVT